MLRLIAGLLMSGILFCTGCQRDSLEHSATPVDNPPEVFEDQTSVADDKLTNDSLNRKDYLHYSLLYINNDYSYQIEFPENLEDYFVVNDANPKLVKVMLNPKSNLGKKMAEDMDGGITIFYIAHESMLETEPLDSEEKIATINGNTFYFATDTGNNIGELRAASEKKVGDDAFGITITEKELDLLKEDWKMGESILDSKTQILDALSETHKDEGTVHPS